MKRWKQAVIALALFVGGVGVVVPAASVSAIDVFEQCTNNSDAKVCEAQGTDDFSTMMKAIINTLLFILGAIAVLMIVIGGIRYATSAGDSAAITGAKNTILYSVIGLVVAILAFAIVNFVVDAFRG